MPILATNKNYKQLIENIGITITKARSNAYMSINNELLRSYWNTGKYIVEYEQSGKIKADYGKKLLIQLSKDLTLNFGKGFSRSNLQYMRLLYQYYPKCQMPSGILSWSHYVELISIDNKKERNFYEAQAINERWSVKELKRQKKNSLFVRLASKKTNEEIIELSEKGQIIKTKYDILREPYILEFLEFPENYKYTETELEQRIINNLQKFLLELGKGFAFVGRQYRVTLNNRHFFVDLVFYHIKLQRYVLIDLKLPKVKHHHVGQMNMYLGYFATEINEQHDKEPIGIILTQEKDDIMIEYATYKLQSNLFVAKYQTYLPDKSILRQKVREILDDENEKET